MCSQMYYDRLQANWFNFLRLEREILVGINLDSRPPKYAKVRVPTKKNGCYIIERIWFFLVLKAISIYIDKRLRSISFMHMIHSILI